MNEADHDRVLGMIRAYLRGKASTAQAVEAVNTSSPSFRGHRLKTILDAAEANAITVDAQTRHELMANLKEELQKKGFLN